MTYLAIAGLAGGSIGFATPAQAAPAEITNCAELETELNNAYSLGGTINADFSGTCDFSEGFVFGGETTITGPTNGNLTFRFTGDRGSTAIPVDYYADGFTAFSNLTISNINFTRPSDSGGFDYFVFGNSLPVVISNSTFSGAEISAAIYVEGDLNVSDSSFENLTSYDGGAAIKSTNPSSVNEITNSIFVSNRSMGQSSAGAIATSGSLSVTDSTFESNSTQSGFGGAIMNNGNLTVKNSVFSGNSANQSAGGAIFGFSNVDVDNSTFVNNSAFYAGASYSEGGGVISNSTFWQNSDVDESSTTIASSGSTHFFANILADEKPISADRSYDLGANLYTDTTFEFGSSIEIVPVSVSEASILPSTVEGSSRRVTLDELKLSSIALNSTGPVNIGKTKTVAIGAGSVARDFYSTTSAGINPTGLNIPDGNQFATRIAALDQRGVARQPSVNRLDVGAYEYGETPTPETVTTPETVATIAKQKIKFAPGSSRLSSASKKKLRTLATEIQAKGLKNVNLEGYTATLTKAAPSGKVFRVKLSKARTAAVEKYLKQQFKKSGYTVTFTKSLKGAANPVKSNKNEKGRKDNRRVEILID